MCRLCLMCVSCLSEIMMSPYAGDQGLTFTFVVQLQFLLNTRSLTSNSEDFSLESVLIHSWLFYSTGCQVSRNCKFAVGWWHQTSWSGSGSWWWACSCAGNYHFTLFQIHCYICKHGRQTSMEGCWQKSLMWIVLPCFSYSLFPVTLQVILVFCIPKVRGLFLAHTWAHELHLSCYWEPYLI